MLKNASPTYHQFTAAFTLKSSSLSAKQLLCVVLEQRLQVSFKSQVVLKDDQSSH